MPDVLYEEVVEVHERVVLFRDDCKLNDEIRGKNEHKTTTTGDQVFKIRLGKMIGHCYLL
jgi:hypothetical protein